MLLRVSKRTYAETVGILYGKNIFSFFCWDCVGPKRHSFDILYQLSGGGGSALHSAYHHLTVSSSRSWSNNPTRERERGDLETEFDCMARTVVKWLDGVEEIEIDLDGPYGTPVLRRPPMVVF